MLLIKPSLMHVKINTFQSITKILKINHMEYQVLDEKTTKESSLCLDSEGIADLKNGRGWALFLVILGFVGIGFLVIAAIAMFVAGSAIGGGAMTGILGLAYIVIAGIYIIPLIFLLRFTSSVATACNQSDSSALKMAIRNLRLHFKSLGIIIIAMVIIYIIVIIGIVAYGAMRGF
jgi:hypothetical protein